MLGIIISITSVVLILVVWDAVPQKVLANIKAIGTNTITVYPCRDYGDDDPSNRQLLIYENITERYRTNLILVLFLLLC